MIVSGLRLASLRIPPWYPASITPLLKGILSPHDAMDAVNAGADAIIVSNHGGRALDGALSSIESLGPVVKVDSTCHRFGKTRLVTANNKSLLDFLGLPAM